MCERLAALPCQTLDFGKRSPFRLLVPPRALGCELGRSLRYGVHEISSGLVGDIPPIHRVILFHYPTSLRKCFAYFAHLRYVLGHMT